MTPEEKAAAEKAIIADVIAQAWDSGFEHCRAVAALLCLTSGWPDLASAIEAIPLRAPADAVHVSVTAGEKQQ